jgi:hypothetical protein
VEFLALVPTLLLLSVAIMMWSGRYGRRPQ